MVFFKGCPLRCSFCQNPETQALLPELAVAPERCLHCGLCVPVCAAGALDPRAPGIVDRARCDACGACAEVCPSRALRRIGVAYTPEVLAEVVLRDRHFYHHTGGGITLSGGEPTLFPGYLEQLLRLIKAEGVHVALETGGYFTDYDAFRDRVLPYVDLIDFSLKLADPAAHRAVTGKSNRIILDNLRRLAREPRVRVEASIPLVPGITATRDNLAGLIDLLRDAGIFRVRLLPYNPLGVHMAAALGRPPPAAPGSFMPIDEYARIRRLFEDLVERAAARDATRRPTRKEVSHERGLAGRAPAHRVRSRQRVTLRPTAAAGVTSTGVHAVSSVVLVPTRHVACLCVEQEVTHEIRKVTSEVLDFKRPVTQIEGVTWEDREPDGAALSVAVRSCPQMDCSDGAWAPSVARPTSIAPARYLQLRAELTSDGVAEPELRALRIKVR